MVDGVVTRAIDKDVLIHGISAQDVEGSEERYQFTCPDKKKFVLLQTHRITKAFALAERKA